uniref:Interleukin-6 receptor beta n=1 Tax=Plecoglossus altivelis TaxID=61084 RepID=A0A6B7RCN8_PLEAT|nr:interleukin-6 receptor beta [Plecoglossus altivelis]
MDTLGCWLPFLSLVFLSSTASGAIANYGMIQPQSPTVEIGKNFTATCVLYKEALSTAEDIYWTNVIEIPKDQYTKINDSAVNVTISITENTEPWLYCKSRQLHSPVHGILLTKEYPPGKPTNLSCEAVQSGQRISPYLSCTWVSGLKEPQSGAKYTVHSSTLFVSEKDFGKEPYKNHTQKGSGIVDLSTFPYYVLLEIWVEEENKLGKVQSDHLEIDANELAKTNPPFGVKLIPENEFPRSLRVEWEHPISELYLRLRYHIRFCTAGSKEWFEVPQSDTENYMKSFRLQDLKPDTVYVVQVRCIHKGGGGHWSGWSKSAEGRTPEAKPASKPDVWRVIVPVEGRGEREVQVISKAPVESNGKIREYDIRFPNGKWETVTVNNTDLDSSSQERKITVFRKTAISDSVKAHFAVIGRNSVGVSPTASLVIPKISQDLPHVEALGWYNHEGKLWVKWDPSPINMDNLSEYVVEWVSASDGQMDWQREHKHRNQAAILGNLQKFTRYNVSVYPVYSGMAGKPMTTVAFLEQGAPLEAPALRLKRIGKYDVELEWFEIPLDKQRGIIVNYTIFCWLNGKEYLKETIPPTTHSYTLKPLSSHTSYVVWIRASTINGSVDCPETSFSTLKYAPGQIEGIVVGVCFAFLLCVLAVLILWFNFKSWIKKIFWPDVPNPSNSTIATWSPDFPSKPDTPKEGALANVSVMEVEADMLDSKSLFEEEKTCLPLKKDKYLSEEHSSGIGGSSCMSSPRQSVSDSDEGSDSGQTTASTVQYSSVVASSGYKGQTPSLLRPSQGPTQQPTFARSESTQPLLDSEEHPDLLGQESGGQTQRYPCNPYFRRWPGASEDGGQPAAEFNHLEMEGQGGVAMLRFSPVDEISQQTTPTEEGQSSDGQPADPICSYMPQLNGYRPQ